MNAKLSVMGIVWASERTNKRLGGRVTSDALLCVAIHSPNKTPQLVASFHQRLMNQSSIKIGDKIDVGIDKNTKAIYIKKSDGGNRICHAGGNAKSNRGIARFMVNERWCIKPGKHSMSDCTEVESADGLIAAKLPNELFAE
jgi:hypothetical protein